MGILVILMHFNPLLITMDDGHDCMEAGARAKQVARADEDAYTDVGGTTPGIGEVERRLEPKLRKTSGTFVEQRSGVPVHLIYLARLSVFLSKFRSVSQTGFKLIIWPGEGSTLPCLKVCHFHTTGSPILVEVLLIIKKAQCF